jgi:DNA-directed RNA polymerase specialized sigma24 family protein
MSPLERWEEFSDTLRLKLVIILRRRYRACPAEEIADEALGDLRLALTNDPGICDPAAWVAQIALSKASKREQQQRHTQEDFSSFQRLQCLEQCLKKELEAEQLALVEARARGSSHRELAKRFHTSPAAIGARLWYTRARLAKCLKNCLNKQINPSAQETN